MWIGHLEHKLNFYFLGKKVKNKRLLTLSALCLLSAMNAYSATLELKKDIPFNDNGRFVYLQEGKVFNAKGELDLAKGRCEFISVSGQIKSIAAGRSLKVTSMSTQVEVKKIKISLQGNDSLEYTMNCKIPEFPTQQNLRGIVLKKISEDKAWTAKYNDLKKEEQAETLRRLMSRAANEILDEEFEVVLSGLGNFVF